MVLQFKNVISTLPCARRRAKATGRFDEWKADQLAGSFGLGQKLEREIDG